MPGVRTTKRAKSSPRGVPRLSSAEPAPSVAADEPDCKLPQESYAEPKAPVRLQTSVAPSPARQGQDLTFVWEIQNDSDHPLDLTLSQGPQLRLRDSSGRDIWYPQPTGEAAVLSHHTLEPGERTTGRYVWSQEMCNPADPRGVRVPGTLVPGTYSFVIGWRLMVDEGEGDYGDVWSSRQTFTVN
jgi:hypothetical protein